MILNEGQRRQILVETVKTFGAQEWFRDAGVFNCHEITGVPTLEIKVNYIPLFERKAVIEFALKHNLQERFVVVDRNGKPAE